MGGASGSSNFGKSKGGEFGHFGEGNSSEFHNCESLRGETIVSSPVPAVVKKLSIGDTLDVTLNDAKPPVIAKTTSGEVVGVLIPRFLVDLIKCMNSGYVFCAEVIEVNGGVVKVLVKGIKNDI